MERTIDHLKKVQAEFANDSCTQDTPIQYEGNLYHDYFRALPFSAVKVMLEDAGISLTGKSVLVASCGTGIDLHYLKKHYAPSFTVTDISENFVRKTQSLHAVPGRVADTELLPFGDNSFDYAFVAASLHHLPRPIFGLYELLRVARFGVMVIEPNDSALTRFATRLGLATEIEHSGNYVYRFSARDVERVARALFYRYRCVGLFAIHRVAKTAVEFEILRLLNGLANRLLPQMGNYICFLIEKTGT